MGLPTFAYFASIALRISLTGVPLPCISITARVMSVQMPQVAAWLVNVTRSFVSAFT